MDEVKIIEIKKSIFEDNDRDADRLRAELKEKGVFLLNLMSSPGSGKTTTLISAINLLKDKLRIAVMEADIDSDVDAKKIKEATGIDTIQLHTGGMCHLDAEMTRQGLDNLPLAQTDLAILENVGNLVCPAEFDTGSCRNVMILSVPEGHDKPLKYPLMFSICDVVLVNKIDVAPYFDFDLQECIKNINMRNPLAKVIPICAKTGQGVEVFTELLCAEGCLADGAVDDVCFIETVFDLTGFGVCYCLCNIGSNCACLGAGHKSAGTENFTETANKTHHVGCCDGNVEIHKAFALDLCNKVFSADDLCACYCGCICIRALCEYCNSDSFTGSVGENNSAADLLVCMTRVNTEADVNFNCLIKFCTCGLNCKLKRICGIVESCSFYELCAFNIFFSVFHVNISSQSCG